MSRPLAIFVPHCSDMLTDHLPHGDGLTACGFITHLAKRGHRLHVAALRVELRKPLPPNVTIHQISPRRTGALLSRLEYMYRVRALLAELRREVAFDLIHQLNPVFTGMSLALAGSNLPLVLGTYVARWPNDPDAVSSRGGLLGRLAEYGRDVISSWQQRQADTLLLTTPAAWNRIPSPGRLRGQVRFLPHGIDANLFSPAAADGRELAPAATSDPRSILFFANVWKRKGIFTLLDAFEQVSLRLPDVRLRIAGEGPDLAEVKRRAAGMASADRIEFLGRQTRDEAPPLYRACTLYCLPSFGEPYGGTIQEAMSCGKPLVVTDSGAPPHLVSKEGGRCVPTGDPEALAAALTEVLEDSELQARMGRHNRQVVESSMAWERVAQQLESIYEITLADWRNSNSPAVARRKSAVSAQNIARERIG
ncbi:MAG TPA: glycosyltransferase family 4 protein [Candidatus Saccharimonadales bacterium]|nr:glycosyltransferase family 4 protein [Candidatus Saccharimonadales bacterium]